MGEKSEEFLIKRPAGRELAPRAGLWGGFGAVKEGIKPRIQAFFENKTCPW
jgi:hypothetical protein